MKIFANCLPFNIATKVKVQCQNLNIIMVIDMPATLTNII